MGRQQMNTPSSNDICARLGVSPLLPERGSKLGLALSDLGKIPIHGDRLRPANGTNGWYIWCGEHWSSDADFYAPLCVDHFPALLDFVVPYLSLPPGYRFILDGQGYEDVWYDEAMLRKPES